MANAKGKAIPVTGRRGPQGCEMPRVPHFLYIRFTDGGEVSLKRRPPFTARKILGTHFCYRLSRCKGHSAAGRIRSIENSNYLFANGARDDPAYSIVPRRTTLPGIPPPPQMIYLKLCSAYQH
jgi:hypothetical protein